MSLKSGCLELGFSLHVTGSRYINFYCLAVKAEERRDRVFACRFSDPGSIQGWDRM